MPIFKYIAKNKRGEDIKGKVEAVSKMQAVSTLFARDLFVIDVTTASQDKGLLSKILKPKIKFEE